MPPLPAGPYRTTISLRADTMHDGAYQLMAAAEALIDDYGGTWHSVEFERVGSDSAGTLAWRCCAVVMLARFVS